MHIRVSLNINLLLRQCLWVNSQQAQDNICIILVYEKLPNFCFKYGKLGHVHRDCDNQEGKGSTLKFGAWLNASSVSRERKLNPSKSDSSASQDSPIRICNEEVDLDVMRSRD